MTADDRVLLTTDFIWELNNYFHFLSIKEFETIVSDGIRNKFTSNTIGLSIVNFNIWYNEWLQQKNKYQISIQSKIVKHCPDKVLPPPPVTIESLHNLMILESKSIETELELDNLFKLSADFIYNKLESFNRIKKDHYLIRLKDVQLEYSRNLTPLKKSMEEAIGNHQLKKTSEAKRLVLIDYFNSKLKTND